MTEFKLLESLPNSIDVVCQKNGSVVSNFTEGKIYSATRKFGITFSLNDDKGHERVIIPNEPCPHLWKTVNNLRWPEQKSVGKFVVKSA